MPAIMSDSLNVICERVYRGRRNLFTMGLRPSELEDVKIVVSPEIWREMTTYRRDMTDPIQREMEVRSGEEVIFTIRMWGIEVVEGPELMPNQVRFRSEVVL